MTLSAPNTSIPDPSSLFSYAPSPRRDDDLCARCGDLNLASYLEGQKKNELWACLTLASLHKTCALCRQIRNLFSIPDAIQPAFGRKLAPELPAVYLRSFDRQDNPRFPVFNISFNGQAFDLVDVSQERKSPADPVAVTFASGRVVDGGGITFDIVKEWLEHCRVNHISRCGKATESLGGTLLKVIDCRTREMHVVPPGAAYTTLSYLWGTDAPDTTWDGQKLPNQMPQTIEDSIAVTLALGIDYLWVDRYSINQDNPDEKHDIIRNMDKIYRAAQLTVVACEGTDPLHGLPGVGKTPRRAQQRLRIGSHQLVALAPASDEIGGSKWNSRGWVSPSNLSPDDCPNNYIVS
jgi:hypothetical protein